MVVHYRIGILLGVSLLNAGCVSTAEGFLDDIAGNVADAGAKTLLTVQPDDCDDYSKLADKGIGLDFSETRTFELVNSKCLEKVDIAIDRERFSEVFEERRVLFCEKSRGSANYDARELCRQT